MKTRIYTIETISSYVWDHIIHPTLNKGKLKVSTRAIKHVWNNYQEIVSYLISKDCMKLSVCGQGSFRSGVSTYDFIQPCPAQNYEAFSEYVQNKKKHCQSKYLNIDGIFFVTDGISKLDQEKISKICEHGIEPRFADLNRRFYHDIISLSKKARNMIEYDGNKFVSIDINAAIPRLFPIWLLKKNPSDAVMSELKLWVNSVKNRDAYLGLMDTLNLNMKREEFKTFLLPFLFGAGSEDELDDSIRDSFFTTFPNISKLIKHEANKYRFAKARNIKTWKQGCMANDLFQLEARIINSTLKKLSCKKFSVYDEIYVLENDAEQCVKLLEQNWERVCGDSDLLMVKMLGNLRSAQSDSFVAKAPQSSENVFAQAWKKGLKQTNERGRDKNHISAVLGSIFQTSKKPTGKQYSGYHPRPKRQ